MIKTKIRHFLYVLVNIRTYVFLGFYKLLNFRKPRLFIFTDSRGFEISKIRNRKSPFSSYLLYFIKRYNCDVFICPQKHTTIYDFLYTYSKLQHRGYKYTIAHIGVVDFSPRPEATIQAILKLKRIKITSCFGQDYYNRSLKTKRYKETYNGEPTAAILPEEQLGEIAVRFNKIPQLIWITCNPVDLKWAGNYKRERPANINMVNNKSIILKQLLHPEIKIVDFTSFTMVEVRKYTCDNIHMSAEGMMLIERALKDIIEKE